MNTLFVSLAAGDIDDPAEPRDQVQVAEGLDGQSSTFHIAIEGTSGNGSSRPGLRVRRSP